MCLLDPFIKPQISVCSFHRQLLFVFVLTFEGVWAESIHSINIVNTCESHWVCKKVTMNTDERRSAASQAIAFGLVRNSSPSRLA